MTPLEVAVTGAVAGLGGAALLAPLVLVTRRSLGFRRRTARPNPLAPAAILSEGTHAPPDLLQMTAVFVQKVATGLFGSSLSLRRQRTLGGLWHLAYGAFWGVGYAIVATSVDVPGVILGPLYGVLVWAVGPAWLVPRMRLMLPIGDASRAVTALVIAWHVLYGAFLAVVVGFIGG